MKLILILSNKINLNVNSTDIEPREDLDFSLFCVDEVSTVLQPWQFFMC
jgi:hypothetical protein